ncbi:beta-1,3-glucanase [Clavulina sp. PMI_390]|nr:beta-1,3-glucanase [Clavulina sp. PMI_390]
MLFRSLVAVATLAISQVAALGTSCSAALSPSAAASDPYWLQTITHQGTSAYNSAPASYPVYRNVKDYGAKGDGTTDDTAAINAAITAGSRCGQGCASSTLSPALVFFPSGTYVVSTPIVALYYTALVGDKKNMPTLKASSSFSGIAVIDADPYLAGGANMYTNQNNFFRTVRNFKIDLTAICATCGATGLHWQVAQATSLVNVVVTMSTASGNNHQGIFMENGSGGVMSDLIFNGGKYGVWMGNQQFTVRNMTINNAATGIYLNWAWGWTFQGITFNNCGVGFWINTGSTTANQYVGSASILDSSATATPIFLETSTNQRSSQAGTILLENIAVSNVPTVVQDPSGSVLAGSSGSTTIAQWIQGNTYTGTGALSYKQGTLTKPTKPAGLTANGKVFTRPRPQYENYAASQFVSVKSNGAKGDGVTDDTAALQAVFNKYWGCKIIYVDAGTYLITDTLKIPAGSWVVGELWSNIVASGSKFASASSPHVAVQVGSAGDTADTEISDIVFTTTSGMAGAIVLEWNVGGGSQGAAAMWDSHVRLGGYKGSGIQVSNCGTSTSHPTSTCTSSYLAVHLTSTSSAYFENVWVWAADHDLDDSNQGQIDVYSGRGILIESANPVWLIGTASEHHTLYQYNLASAKAVFIALIQTETPYWQPTPAVPSPFTLSTTYHDPTYPSGQTDAWAFYVQTSSNIYAYGVNLYSFFNNYSQTCLNTYNCQQSNFGIDTASTSVYVYNLNTVASAYLVYVGTTGVAPATTNLDGFTSNIGMWKSTS